MRKTSIALLYIWFTISACGSPESKSTPTREYSRSTQEPDQEENESSPCGYKDGNYSATVDYYNPSTGHTATYDLTVDVKDCEVVQINFNNGGWLDDTHIDPAEVNTDGEAELEDERGDNLA